MQNQINVPEFPQPDFDIAEQKLRDAIDGIRPFMAIASEDSKKKMLKTSPAENSVARDTKDFLVDYPGSITSDFPLANFNRAMSAGSKSNRLLELVNEMLEMVYTNRLVCNHTKKLTILLLKPILTQGVDLGRQEYKPLKEKIDELYTKTFKEPTTFGVEANKYACVENVEGGIYNSGKTTLHIFKGIDQSKDYIVLKPGDEYILPKDYNTITVINPSETTEGEFQVRIK